MDIGVRAEAVPLGQLFCSGMQYRVPIFQRSYSWDETDALDLLNDLIEGMDNKIAHFTGSIVLLQEGSATHHDIVDGQQRLTTLTMILAALRDLLRASDKQRDRVRAALCDDTKKNGALWRLVLNDFDAPFFRAIVQESGATLVSGVEPDGESRERLTKNTERIVKALRALDPQKRRQLADYVLDACGLVVVFVKDRDSAHRVFRILNDRGKQASDHDIVKTEVFEKAGLSHDELAEHAKRWSEYEARIMSKGMDDLLSQMRTIFGPGGRGSRLFDFRRTVMGKISPRKFLNDVLPAYVDATEAINFCVLPDTADPDKKIQHSLRHLSTIDHHQWRAPGLKFVVDRKGDADGARRFFPLLERLAFAMQLVVTEREARIKRYRNVLNAIGDDRELFDGEGPLSISQDEGKKIAERLMGRFTAFSQRRALVMRINAALPDGEVISNQTDVSVEHVLPRNPEEDGYWTTVWPNSAQRAQLCETLGNYVLLPAEVNQRADRMDYRAKKAVYFADGHGDQYAITRDIKDEDIWTPDVVKRRTERLVAAILAAWGLTPLK